MSSQENEGAPHINALDPDVPPGYTLRIFNNEKYIIPNFAVAGLEAKLASREERDRLGFDAVPFSVGSKCIP
jgi:hypothetical protein